MRRKTRVSREMKVYFEALASGRRFRSITCSSNSSNTLLFQRLFICAIQSLNIYLFYLNEFIYEACRVVLLLLIYFLYRLYDILCLLYDATTLLESPLVGLIKLLI